jgi:uncharacterized protein YndB with AHSA1/START domain
VENKASGTLPDIRKTFVFNAPISKVWNAVSTSEGISVWFMPNDFQPVVGHEFHLDAGPYGKSPCKVTEIEPQKRVSFKWGKDWTLTFELADLGDKTEFTLIHGGWGDENQVTEFGELHTIVRERMAQGWSGMGDGKLRAYVEG